MSLVLSVRISLMVIVHQPPGSQDKVQFCATGRCFESATTKNKVLSIPIGTTSGIFYVPPW
jgi:hypothetical protein